MLEEYQRPSAEFIAASKESCSAMAWLANKQTLQNRDQMLYNIDYPACERTREIRDVSAELGMIKSSGISRNLCFDKTPSFGQGAWTAQFAPEKIMLERQVFLESTKEKSKSQM